MAPKIKEGMYVWVKDPSIAGTDLYTKGHILNINGNKVTVETSNDVKTQELIIPVAECFMFNPGKDVRSAHPCHCLLSQRPRPRPSAGRSPPFLHATSDARSCRSQLGLHPSPDACEGQPLDR